MTTLTDAAQLLDYARRYAAFDRSSVEISYGWSRTRFGRAVHDLRHALAEDGAENLICEPIGPGEWIYRLTATRADQLWWRANRQLDTLTRIRTIRAVNMPLIAGSSGRTVEGKLIRQVDKALARLIEDLETLVEDMPT